jgi:hypothetical protein
MRKSLIMIKFEILASYYYKGGNHYLDIEAENPQDVISELKHAWYKSGISEGELELLAYPIDDNGEEIQLFFGHCSMDDDGEFYCMFDFPFEEDEIDKWYEFGLFLNNLDGDSFEKALEALFNYDSPDRTIGAKLYKLSKVYETLSAEDKSTFSKNLLPEILGVFSDPNKSQEMHKWLCSSDGKQYLVSNPLFEPAGRLLLKAIEQES